MSKYSNNPITELLKLPAHIFLGQYNELKRLIEEENEEKEGGGSSAAKSPESYMSSMQSNANAMMKNATSNIKMPSFSIPH